MKIFDTETTQENLIWEKGSDKLTIAFAGLPTNLSEVRHDFYHQTSGMDCSKIFVKDPTMRWYQKGIDAEIDSIPKLQRKLEELVAELNPSRIVCIGISAGAYAALLFGHLLKADKVHSFGPQTFLSPELHKKYQIPWETWCENLIRVHNCAEETGTDYHELRPILMDNQKTEHIIHVCSRHVIDMKYAYYLVDVPGLRIVEYDCDEHAPASYLKRFDKLREVLES